MSSKQFRVNLACQCEGCTPDIKSYVKKIKGFWHQLFDNNASAPRNKSYLTLECQCAQKITKFLKNVQGVDNVAVNLIKGTVTVEGNFKEADVINCFWEKMEKKAEVVNDQEQPGKHVDSGNGCDERPRLGRCYGEIEELW